MLMICPVNSCHCVWINTVWIWGRRSWNFIAPAILVSCSFRIFSRTFVAFISVWIIRIWIIIYTVPI